MYKLIIMISILISILFTNKSFLLESHKETRNIEKLPYLNKLIWVESSNRPYKVSHKGAIGLMQVLPEGGLADHNTFCKCGINYNKNELFKPRINKHVGIWYYKQLGKYYGNKVKQISAYNMGYGNTDKGIINFDYVFKIMGTNKVLTWLNGRKVKSWKGSTRAYYVLE